MEVLDDFRRDLVMSIRPNYASRIVDGTKTVELRRRFPEVTATGAMALIYSSRPVQAIIGYAWIREVHRLPTPQIWREYGANACIKKSEFDRYFVGLVQGYAIVLENARRLRDKVDVQELKDSFGFVPPQSFRYLGEEFKALLNDERLQTHHRY